MAVGMMMLALPLGALPGPAAASAADEPTLLPRSEARARPVLRRGDSGPWVLRVNAALNVQPLKDRFRRKTARAVKAFRSAHGLRARGIVNARTWRLLGAIPQPAPPAPADGAVELRRGMTSEWVRAVQTALGVQPVTGYYGTLTEAAVKQFQRSAGLPETGVVDAATWERMAAGVPPPAADPTMTDAARGSADARAAIGVAAFVSSPAAQHVVDRESRGICTAVSPGGTWRGKWQMDAAFWAANGGQAFAPTPDGATCSQQDEVAFRGWVDRWWQPWQTSTFPG
jgi:peptidoglycan hydrolase-like protein with peptidoglycan-binding domain